MPKRKKEIKELEKEKEDRLLRQTNKQEGQAVMALEIPLASAREWNVPRLNKGLLWYRTSDAPT